MGELLAEAASARSFRAEGRDRQLRRAWWLDEVLRDLDKEGSLVRVGPCLTWQSGPSDPS